MPKLDFYFFFQVKIAHCANKLAPKKNFMFFMLHDTKSLYCMNKNKLEINQPIYKEFWWSKNKFVTIDCWLLVSPLGFNFFNLFL